jgi:arylsulfatase A-like enzyme
VEGISHAGNLAGAPDENKQIRTEVYTTKTYHDSFDPIRAIRTKEYSYIENYASRPLLDLPWDIADSAPGRALTEFAVRERPERELYDLLEDPAESHNLLSGDVTDKAEAIANDLALLLDDWRQKTNDVIPSEFAGTRISERYTETYLRIHGRAATSRSAIAADRGIEHDHGSRQ